jgi:predicted 3-demethylubiquinone-9 3-methyltransferase (glyoxalase superfamily)
MSTQIATCLWFNGDAEEAATLYTSLLGGSLDSVTPYPEGSPFPTPFPPGTAMLVEFTLGGHKYQGLNGGPIFPLSECVSISVTCKDQAELDARFDMLTADGGSPSQCGWLKDRFGLSWQLVPEDMIAMQKSGDGAAVQRMSMAMVQMQKLDIAALKAAFEGETV